MVSGTKHTTWSKLFVLLSWFKYHQPVVNTNDAEAFEVASSMLSMLSCIARYSVSPLDTHLKRNFWQTCSFRH